MGRETSTKKLVLSRLTQGPVRMTELVRLTGLRSTSVAAVITRLRDEQFKIVSIGRGDPTYELLSGPGSLSSSFLCPKCSLLIRLGHPSDHATSCAFGTQQNLNGASIP